MINLVAVVKDVTSLQGTDDAKSVAWALQLQIEEQMIQELKGLQVQGLSDEIWWFLEAVAFAATGNVMHDNQSLWRRSGKDQERGVRGIDIHLLLAMETNG